MVKLRWWQSQARSNIGYIKYAFLLALCISIADLLDGFLKFLPPTDYSGLGLLLVWTIGLFFIWTSKDYGLTAHAGRSLLAGGLGFVVMGCGQFTSVSTSFLVQILVGIFSSILFLIAVVEASRTEQVQ